MEKALIDDLMSSFGFIPRETDETQKKTRYQGEDTFLDLWQGKKGTTVGIYMKKYESMEFHRPHDLEDLEDVLIKAVNRNAEHKNF